MSEQMGYKIDLTTWRWRWYMLRRLPFAVPWLSIPIKDLPGAVWRFVVAMWRIARGLA